MAKRPPRGPGKAKQPRRKRIAKKKSSHAKANTVTPNNKRITDAVGDKMFARWCEEYKAAGGWSGLAKEFEFHRDSIRNYAKRHKWEQHYLKYRAKSQKKTTSDLASRHAEKMKQYSGLAQAALLSQVEFIPDPANPGKKLIRLKKDITLTEALQAAKYEDELGEKFPDRGDESTVTATEEEVALFVSALETLGKEGLKAMGKLIVEKARLEKERATNQAQ